MTAVKYVVPILLTLLIAYCIIKKVNLYDVFVKGVSEALPLVISIFPYITAIFLLCEVFEISGLSLKLTNLLAPVVEFFGIPKELTRLILLKPFSGSGSLSLLTEIYKTYGADSYLSITASAIYGSSETVFYISAVYLSKCKNKKATKAILISLFATFFATVLCCNLLKILY